MRLVEMTLGSAMGVGWHSMEIMAELVEFNRYHEGTSINSNLLTIKPFY